ncbi:putative ZDHHC-type palmitoyltransferase 2 [Schistocerca americana]|uniref:putative ZDHHC-type palmitoyltransferase 2 n=1 Tax=Schistocerca americana TaxID=7009 RepID=UPI001F4FB2F1|nr:putative ZDHHC-type palmitoyltransferase 2 [Schistocerca americana]XP_049951150.1 putative ZDHHC-type palmitoyltransferase 2 [Schistocerca serialis cubense]
MSEYYSEVVKVSSRMNDSRVQILKIFPVFTVLFSLWVLYVTLRVLDETGQSILVFALLLSQVYLNWLALLLGNRNCTASRSQDKSYFSWELLSAASDDYDFSNSSPPWDSNSEKNVEENKFYDYDFVSNTDITMQRIWYCPRCCQNSFIKCSHCSVCKKCIIERDHHCFFLGTCISMKNITYFIILLIYTGLTSSYVTLLLCNKMNLLDSSTTVLMEHFFPVSFAKWLSGEEYTYNLIEKLLLNVCVSLALFSLAFAAYYLCKAARSKTLQKSHKQRDIISFLKFTRNNASHFRKHNLVNLIFPMILMRYLPFNVASNTHKEN